MMGDRSNDSGISTDELDRILTGTKSEVRGKLARLLLKRGYELNDLVGILAARRSQLYVDLKAAYRLETVEARQPFAA